MDNGAHNAGQALEGAAVFDLDKAISEWRDGISQGEAIGCEDVTELEGHLVEEMGRFVAAGLGEREAFEVAAYRLGQPHRINEEFAKVNGAAVWRRRLLWMTAGGLILILIQGVCQTANYAVVWACSALAAGKTPALLAGILAETAVWAAVGWIGWRLHARSPQGLVGWVHRRWERKWSLATDLAVLAVVIIGVKLALPAVTVHLMTLSSGPWASNMEATFSACAIWPVIMRTVLLPCLLLFMVYLVWKPAADKTIAE